MSLKEEFRKMIQKLTERFTFPPIAHVFFPPFYKGGQPKDAQFMAISLKGGATGISFVLLPDEKMEEYTALQQSDFVGKDPQVFALAFGGTEPIAEILGMATINAMCQHVIRETNVAVDSATDSLGLLSISPGDRIGMVGLFSGLITAIEKAGAELVVIENNDQLIRKYPALPITRDISELRFCNKILSTSTTVLNDSLDEILSACSPDAFISIIGPTAGYFPDPLFARGVDVVGGRAVINRESFFQRLAERRRWEDSTQTTCFQKHTYISMI